MTLVSGCEINSCMVIVMLSQGTSLVRSFSWYLPPTPCTRFSATGFAASTARDIQPLLHEPHTLRILVCVTQPRFCLYVVGRVTRNFPVFLSKSNSEVPCLCAVRAGIKSLSQSDHTCSLVTPPLPQKMQVPRGFGSRFAIARTLLVRRCHSAHEIRLLSVRAIS